MVNSTLPTKGVSSPLASSPIPLYIQLADILRERINQGEWASGGLIPTLEALAETWLSTAEITGSGTPIDCNPVATVRRRSCGVK